MPRNVFLRHKGLTTSCAILVCLVSSPAGKGHAAADGGNDLVIRYSIPDYTTALADGAQTTIYGTVAFVETRDRHSGALYEYAILHTETPYRLKQAENPDEGDAIDDSNLTPTTFIPITAHDIKGGIREFTPYLGRYVKLSGRIMSTNGGGPMLLYKSIALAPRDD